MECASIFTFLLQSFTLHNSISLTTYIMPISILILNLLIITKLKNSWCTCEICQTYIHSRWKLRFPNLCDWYTHLLKTSPTATIHIHVLDNTITANPHNVEHMLRTRFDNFPKGKPFSEILGDLLGKGIFNVDGDLWRFQRKLAGLELTRLSVRAFVFETVNHEIVTRLLPLLESVCEKRTDVLDLQDIFQRFSFDCICKFSFGLDPKCLEKSSSTPSEFTAAFDLASRLSAERAMTSSPLVWKIKRFFNIGSERRLRQAIRVVNLLALDVIREKQKLGFSNDPQRDGDLLSRFINCSSNEVFLRDIVVNFLLAGRDTVASGLTGFFHLVARHSEAEARILQEADEVIGPGRGPACYERARDLHYLHAAVHESMRLYPPVQFDSKFCLEDDLLPDGSLVKKGTRVTYHPYAMGRSEEIWGEDCLEFRPERWLRDGVFCPVSPFKYPVFQAGLRVCLGKEMAIEELKCVAISLLREYRVELVGSQGPARFSPGLTATYQDGLRVLIRRRKSG